ncbi:MAG TPA: MHYT domain-containing protein [Xanthobacteraceae bacterium]|nr:MHYT domain-containing protein [Xanthobacteraceae bacterium]
MPITHEPWLVALSLIVAIQGAYVGLSLAVQVGDAVGLRRRLLLAGASLSLAVAIWAMHFVGMLAARLPLPIDYLVFPTLLSFLVCVIVVGVAVFAASAGPLTFVRLAAAAIFMGCGIVSMHYIGMTALHASAHLVHDPVSVAGSVVVAIAASGLALWLAGGRGGRPPLFLSAAVLGMAITGMHYTAMQGLKLFAHASGPSTAPVLSSDLLAIVVAIVAFCVSGIFLLALVPDQSSADARPTKTASLASRAGRPPASSQLRPGTSEREAGDAVADNETAGAPQRRPVRRLPIERDGSTHFVAVDDIVAVHANAHYTYIFDGTNKMFCPLAIGDVEARLDNDRFIRVHRSHIVNIGRIVGLKRAGDNGLIELAAVDHYTVPVSRSRLAWLKSQLELKMGEAVS